MNNGSSNSVVRIYCTEVRIRGHEGNGASSRRTSPDAAVRRSPTSLAVARPSLHGASAPLPRLQSAAPAGAPVAPRCCVTPSARLALIAMISAKKTTQESPAVSDECSAIIPISGGPAIMPR